MDESSLPEVDRHIQNDISNSYAIRITVAFYGIVLIFGLVTNVILCYLLFTREFFKSKYIFTASISIAHIVFCVLAIPLAITFYVTNDVTVRKICDVIVCLFISATTHSMVGTSVRRCLALSKRFRHANFTFSGKVKHIACIWIASHAIAIPYLFNTNRSSLACIFPAELVYSSHTSRPNSTADSHGQMIINQSDSSMTLATKQFKEHHIEQDNSTKSTLIVDNNSPVLSEISIGFYVYDIALLFLIMLLPICISVILYSVTLHRIKKRPNQTHWVKEIMITKQHITLAAIFFLCWFPAMLVNILGQRIEIEETVYRFLQLVGVTSIFYFPIVYYKINVDMKREFNKWRHGLFNTQQQQPEANNTNVSYM